MSGVLTRSMIHVVGQTPLNCGPAVNITPDRTTSVGEMLPVDEGRTGHESRRERCLKRTDPSKRRHRLQTRALALANECYLLAHHRDSRSRGLHFWLGDLGFREHRKGFPGAISGCKLG